MSLDRLLDSSSYKETYRADMIRWGEEKRNKDAGYFINIVANGPGSEKPIWIISDARRKSDIRFLVGSYGKRATTIRVTASQEVRTARGWRFIPGRYRDSYTHNALHSVFYTIKMYFSKCTVIQLCIWQFL